MAEFAFIKNGVVVNLVVADDAFVRSQIEARAIDSAVELEAGVNPSIGDTYSEGVFSAPIPALADARAGKLRDFATALGVYMNERYPFEARIQLMNLYTLAKEDGLANRAAYLRQGLTWGNSIIAYAASFQSAVMAELDASRVVGMTWDINGNVTTDPGIKAGMAIQILD